MSSALQTDASMVEDDCARNALTRDNPTAMTQLSNAESSRLEALSDELLVSIVEKLVYEGHCAAEIAEFHARINLRHLCLVSKRMDLIARPYLYKKVTITDFDSLAKLHRTISRDPQLGEEIKEIDLNVDFGSATFRKWLAVADNEEFVDKFGQFHPSRKFMRSNRLVGGLCHSVLTGAVNTSSLKMSFRDTKRRDVTFRRDHLENLYLPNRCTPYSGFLDRIGDSLRLSRGGVEFLPRLETLTLCGLSQRLAIEVLKPFLDLPSLKTVQTRGDDGNWCLIAPGSSHSRRIYGGDVRACTNITTLRTPQTSICQFDFEDIAQLFPCLQVLEVVAPFSDSDRLSHYTSNGSMRDLSSSLGKISALQTLKVSIYPHANVTGFEYARTIGQLGPGSVLGLAQLPNLQHLEVPLYMLARTNVSWLPPGEATAVPREVLPKSLKSLVLLAHRKCLCWSWGPDSRDGQQRICWDSRTAACNFLESLGHDLACFPELETVGYCFITKSCAKAFPPMSAVNGDDQAAKDFIGSRLRVICASYLERNVQFCLQTTADQFTSPRTIDVRDWDD